MPLVAVTCIITDAAHHSSSFNLFKCYSYLDVFAEEGMAKAHRTLTSSKAPHIKKRQVMNSMFGDYRAKMAEEESKIKIGNLCGKLFPS